MEPWLVAAVIVLFVGFLLWNGLMRVPLRRSARETLSTPGGADDELRSLLDQLRQGAQTRSILERIKKRVADQPSPRSQATYLCAVGDVLKGTLSRKATAVRYYLKALEADPTCPEARHGLREILLAQRRGVRLEQVYWKILSRLDFEADDPALVLEIWKELTELLERRRSGRIRAQALRHLMEHWEIDEELAECRADEEIEEKAE